MRPEHDHRDGPRDECGVFGIYAPGHDVARVAYFGLYALQHRGQESAGIATAGNQGTPRAAYATLFRRCPSSHEGMIAHATLVGRAALLAEQSPGESTGTPGHLRQLHHPARARNVIIWAKRSSSPPSSSPNADAASLADLVTSPSKASSTVSRVSGVIPSFEGGWDAAW